MRTTRGFTLLEVMVAVAILGIGLTAILSAQAGNFATSAYARNVSVATGLLRCKMGEIEEDILKRGYPASDEHEEGVCCEGDESKIRCAWAVEKPEFPPPKYGELDLDSELDLSGDGKGPGQLGAAVEALKGSEGAPPFDEGAGIAGIAQSLTGSGEETPGGGALGMAMGMIYPDLKMAFEASVRKVTVTARWNDGEVERKIDVVQWLAFPQMGPEPDDDPEAEDPE